MKEIILDNVEATRNWAKDFAKNLKAPITVALHGDLGMGKSEIARTIIQTLCGDDTVVPSPTFTLVQTYENKDCKISHFDLYRINDKSELIEIGLPYAVDNDITLIEWPDIADDILPENTINIFLESYKDGRKLTVK